MQDTQFPLWDKIMAADVAPAMFHVLNDSYEALGALEAIVQPTWEGLMLPLERLEDPMDRVWGFTQHLSSVMNNDALINAVAEVCFYVI